MASLSRGNIVSDLNNGRPGGELQSIPHSENSIRACPTCGRQYRAADEKNERCAYDGSTTIVVHADRLLNQIVCDKYKIVSLIGVGAWSEVYKAVDLQSGVPFAVKILHSHLAADPLNVARFTREAEMLLRLKHRCFATIYEQGKIDGNRPCLVMEFLVGLSLDNYLASVGQVTLSQALELFFTGLRCPGWCTRKGLAAPRSQT
jgi:serine/threonine protein kinase